MGERSTILVILAAIACGPEPVPVEGETPEVIEELPEIAEEVRACPRVVGVDSIVPARSASGALSPLADKSGGVDYDRHAREIASALDDHFEALHEVVPPEPQGSAAAPYPCVVAIEEVSFEGRMARARVQFASDFGPIRAQVSLWHHEGSWQVTVAPNLHAGLALGQVRAWLAASPGVDAISTWEWPAGVWVRESTVTNGSFVSVRRAGGRSVPTRPLRAAAALEALSNGFPEEEAAGAMVPLTQDLRGRWGQSGIELIPGGCPGDP